MRRASILHGPGALMALALLLPSPLLGQAGETGFLDRFSVRGHVGWSSNQSSAFSEVQACPSREAREVGIGVSYRLTRGINLAVGGNRLSVFDQNNCVFPNLDLPPPEGAYTRVRTQPAGSVQGYPFGSLWARANLTRRLSKNLSAAAFGGVGYLAGKGIPVGLAGISADMGTTRTGMFVEYESSWYRVQFVTTTRQYLDGVEVSATDVKRTDGQRSSMVRVGLRYRLGRGDEGR